MVFRGAERRLGRGRCRREGLQGGGFGGLRGGWGMWGGGCGPWVYILGWGWLII